MITGLQLAILSGGLDRTRPDSARRTAPARRAGSGRRPGAGLLHAQPRRPPTAAAARTGKERLGLWGLRVLPPGLWVRTPTRELALLRISVAQFYGEKLTFAGLGLLIPPGAHAALQLARPGPPTPDPGARLDRARGRHVLHPELQRARRRPEGPRRVRPRARRLHRPGRPRTPQRDRRHGRRWRPPPRSATRGSSPGSRRN